MPPKSRPRRLKRAKSDAELEKLNLEIEHLKNKSRWTDRIAPFITLLSVIIAVGGFVFSFYQFRQTHQLATAKENREQDIKIQQQIYSDTTELLKIPKDPQATSAKASFLLSDLKYFISLKYKKTPDNPNDTEENAIKNTTRAFFDAVKFDCDFNQSRDVNFIKALMGYWDDFNPYLETDATSNYYILTKYTDALEPLCLKDRALTSQMIYEEDTRHYRFPEITPKLQPAEINHVILLIEGFRDTLARAPDGEIKTMKALDFQWVTCNQTLTQQILGVSFNPQTEPRLKHCLKK